MAGKKTENTQIATVTHKDRRTNIPTKELRGFVEDDEKNPKTILYPRDPSLDPQLVWKGKDEQDQKALEVPAVPVYIQEKIHPQAIIEDLRRTGVKEQQTLSLFSDFNGIKFEDMIEFYQHEQNWSNRMILGDSLLVMNSLAEKEGLKGKVQMIYIDPPYGIKFGSNWQVSTRKKDVKDGKAEDTNREPEVVKAYRDTWKLGIHSYLAYLRDRLVIARDLLNEAGSIFVQIGEENVHLVHCVMDEVFGSENFCANIIYVTTSTQGSELLPTVNDNLLWFAKDRLKVKNRNQFDTKTIGGIGSSGYNFVELTDTTQRRATSEELDGTSSLPEKAKFYAASDLTSSHYSISEPIEVEGKQFTPGNRYWSTSTEGMVRLRNANRLLVVGNGLRFKRYFDDFSVFPRNNVWTDTGVAGFTSDRKVYVVQTNQKVIQRCLLMTTDPGDLVLDPTCGGGTTAYVAEQWGRRWITIDTSRVAVTLARPRIMAARFPYYFLNDTAEGAKKEAEITGKLPLDRKCGGDVRKGFVYKRVPHVTLKSIANNTEIDEVHDRWDKKLEPVLEKLNRLRKTKWKEWEVPQNTDKDWPKEAKVALEEWWRLWLERQKEIDASIARKADTEFLYDQPYEDKKKIRVTGPFTVESLSPHRMLAADTKKPAGEVESRESDNRGQFVTMIVENLKSAGVQNTKKKERLKFSRLEPHAGTEVVPEIRTVV